jgi:hypothetical protein
LFQSVLYFHQPGLIPSPTLHFISLPDLALPLVSGEVDRDVVSALSHRSLVIHYFNFSFPHQICFHHRLCPLLSHRAGDGQFSPLLTHSQILLPLLPFPSLLLCSLDPSHPQSSLLPIPPLVTRPSPNPPCSNHSLAPSLLSLLSSFQETLHSPNHSTNNSLLSSSLPLSPSAPRVSYLQS